MRRWSSIIALVLFAFIAARCRAQDNDQTEADRLAVMLEWHSGSVVAEIGAGHGQMTLAAAKDVGPTGRVYSTELDPKLLAHLEELAQTNKNITAVKAAEAETDLPEDSCDSIFMKLVYHHLTKPVEIDASLFRSLKPGGLLAVIDEEPGQGSTRVEGVPENRGGHGVPQKILIEELTSVGFRVVQAQGGWPDNGYCVVFRKPST